MGGSLIHSGFLRLGTGQPFKDFHLGRMVAEHGPGVRFGCDTTTVMTLRL